MKRILTITPYAIGDTHALGITMEKFFRNCDINSIFQIYFNEVDKNRMHYKKEYKYDYLWYYHKNKIISDESTNVSNSSESVRISTKLKASIVECLPICIPKDLKKKIDDFMPEVIYVQLYGYNMIRLVEKILHIYKMPLVIHLLDEWVEISGNNRLFRRAYNKIVKYSLLRLSKKTTCFFGASPIMCDYIQQEFGKNAEFVMPYEAFPECYPSFKLKNKVLKLAYTGNIELGRFKEIIKFLEAMDKRNVKYHLDVYTRQGYLLNGYYNEHLTVHESVPYSDVLQIINSSDGLIHVESFEKENIKFTKYSLSTKIPEYLSSGRPIFYLGPSIVGTGDFLNRGYAECSEISDDLVEKLISFYSENENYINDVLEKRFKNAKELLSEEIMGERFSRWFL